MTNNNKNLFNRIIEKEVFIILAAKEFNRDTSTIRANWITMGNVPDYFEVRFHQLLINFIKCEINKTKQIIK